MNQAIQHRIQFANELVQRFSEVGAHSILIGGSVAKGWADDYSDVELCLCWHSMPSLAKREQIIAILSGYEENFSNSNLSEPIQDHFIVNGLPIDMWHCPDEAIDDLIVQSSQIPLPVGKQETLWVIQNGIVIQGSKQLDEWRKSILLPRSIQAKMVETHLEVITSCDLSLFANRGDVAVLFGLISGIQKRIMYLLFALNGTFSMGIKSMEHSLKTLPIKPCNSWERFQNSYCNPLETCVEQTESLISDVSELVKKHLPEASLNLRATRRSTWMYNQKVSA